MTSSRFSAETLVRHLALYADLPLPPEREAAVASVLTAWLDDANDLSRKMSASQYRTLVPATVLRHDVRCDEDA